MNEVIKAGWIGRDIREVLFTNSKLARNYRPGQFLIVRLSDDSERIPLTIVDIEGDTVRIIFQKVGYSTEMLCSLEAGDRIAGVAGPLGKPTEIKNFGKVVCMAGGIGAAPLKPVVRALKEAGNRVTVIEGTRSKEYLILKDELESLADEFILVSDDGSAGNKGLVTEPFAGMIEKGEIPDHVFAVGPPVMMRAVSVITKQHNIPLTVSLNPIMVDGTGMCGSCRVEVGGETKFACVDGPEFDGNKVNFDLLINRLSMYKKEEARKREHYERCCGRDK